MKSMDRPASSLLKGSLYCTLRNVRKSSVSLFIFRQIFYIDPFFKRTLLPFFQKNLVKLQYFFQLEKIKNKTNTRNQKAIGFFFQSIRFYIRALFFLFNFRIIWSPKHQKRATYFETMDKKINLIKLYMLRKTCP